MEQCNECEDDDADGGDGRGNGVAHVDVGAGGVNDAVGDVDGNEAVGDRIISNLFAPVNRGLETAL